MCIAEQHRGNLLRPDGLGGPNVDKPTLGADGLLPFKVGYLAFSHELQQVCWPSVHTYKPEIPEK